MNAPGLGGEDNCLALTISSQEEALLCVQEALEPTLPVLMLRFSRVRLLFQRQSTNVQTPTPYQTIVL